MNTNGDCRTLCPIPQGGTCQRHGVRKTPQWVRLCLTRPDYFAAWEEGRGPGQHFVRTPEQITARRERIKEARAKTIESFRERFWGQYGASPLFARCLECNSLIPQNAACALIPGTCQDRHLGWIRAITVTGRCPRDTAASRVLSPQTLHPDTWVTLSQLAADSTRLAAALEPVDAVLGIGRSGLLPATIVAVMHHAPLFSCGTFPEFSKIRSCGNGWRMLGSDPPLKTLAIVDDTAAHGGSIYNVTQMARDRWPEARIIRAVVYAHPKSLAQVDLAVAELDGPHYLEWNLFNAAHAETMATDLDGILCPDPPAEAGDEDPQYLAAIRSAPALQRPRRRELPLLVTARLERWRGETEAWLARNGIRYQRLIMGPWPTIAERADGWPENAAKLKADAYRASACKLFVESDPVQARRIVQLTGAPVLCPKAGGVLR